MREDRGDHRLHRLLQTAKSSEGGKATDFVLAMGQVVAIPGFEDGVKGHSWRRVHYRCDLPGSTTLKTPKSAALLVNLKKAEEREPPELTEEFIKRFGVEDGSAAGLRAEVIRKTWNASRARGA